MDFKGNASRGFHSQAYYIYCGMSIFSHSFFYTVIVTQIKKKQIKQKRKCVHSGEKGDMNIYDVLFFSRSSPMLKSIAGCSRIIKVLDEAGIRRPRFHNLRHSAATNLLSMEVNVKVVQEISGYSRRSTSTAFRNKNLWL